MDRQKRRKCIEQRKQEVSESTVQAYHYRLKHFVRWCEQVDEITNLNEITGRNLQRHKLWRRDDGDLNNVMIAHAVVQPTSVYQMV